MHILKKMDTMQSALHIILAQTFWMQANGNAMMDEYVDVWYIHKAKYDYAGQLADWCRNKI